MDFNIYNYNFVTIQINVNNYANTLTLPKALYGNTHNVINIHYNSDYYISFRVRFLTATTAEIALAQVSNAWKNYNTEISFVGSIKI